MSIAARCADCNKGYRVDEKLAGRTLRCKACGGAVAVPEAGETAPVAQAPAPAKAPAPRRPAAATARPAVKPAAAASADPFDNMDALLNLEAGGTVQDEGMPALAPPPLPKNPPRRGGGDVPMAAPAYVAPARASTVPQRRPGWKPGGQQQQGGGIASGVAAKALMITAGVLALLFVLGLAVAAIKPAAGMILAIVGILMMLAGGLGCLVTAFKESVACGLMYMFIPFGIYALYFVFSRLEQTKGYLVIYVVGLASMLGGVALLPSSAGPA
jgi:hypothetical protein